MKKNKKTEFRLILKYHLRCNWEFMQTKGIENKTIWSTNILWISLDRRIFYFFEAARFFKEEASSIVPLGEKKKVFTPDTDRAYLFFGNVMEEFLFCAPILDFK